MAIILHRIAQEPNGQYFDKISIKVKGIVTKHSNKSRKEKQKTNINMTKLDVWCLLQTYNNATTTTTAPDN